MGFENDIDEIEGEMASRQRRFDEVNELCRSMIRSCARAITAMHNDDAREVDLHLKSARGYEAQLAKRDSEFRYLSLQAYQELAEARILHGIKGTGRIPGISKVGVSRDAYLLGLMDVVGELKRGMLVALMKGNRETASRYFSLMGSIYDSTRGLRFTEAILPNFRKKQDVARIQLENAGSDILRFSSDMKAAKKRGSR